MILFRAAGRAALLAVPALLTLTACGGDDSPPAEPDPIAYAPGASSSAATQLCDLVTDKELSGWAGRPVFASTRAHVDGVTECTAVSDDKSIVVTWQTGDAVRSLDAEADRVNVAGLERSSVTVGNEEAALLVGTGSGSRHAQVVAILGDQSLFVDVGWLRGVGPEASFETLRDLAVGVADRVAS